MKNYVPVKMKGVKYKFSKPTVWFQAQSSNSAFSVFKMSL